MRKLFGLLAALMLVGAADARAADVGHTVKHLVVPGSAQGEPRQVDVQLWYPSANIAGRSKSVYRSALFGRPLPAPYTPLGWSVEAEIAREGAPIDPQGKPFPVIVFSHGSVNDPIDYAHTLERIAAAGFVIAAPSHVNNTQDDVRIDYANATANAQFLCNDSRPGPCSRTQVAFSMADRVRDISSVLDALPGWFGDRVDMARAGALGHSRGSASVLAAAGGSTARVAGDANCQPTGDTCWPLQPEPRIQAVMGMAIAAMPIAQRIDFSRIKVPVQLVAGFLDRTSPQAVSEFAFNSIASPDKAFLSLPNGVHRTFDSTYCAQTQSAGAIAQADANAILDRHTFELTALAPPAGASGKASYYCAASYFTSPVNIEPLMKSTAGAEYPPAVVAGGVCSLTTVPCTGLDTDQVKQQMTTLAVNFFTAKLARAAGGVVSGTVPATLSLTLAGSASFGAFTPGADKEYTAQTAATVVSTAGDATLSVSDPGHLMNGGFSLPQPLRVEIAPASWTAPVSNASAAITFRQHIGANDALRTGSYSKTLTFTLSTTTP
jgi:predicted dienelactone hydrolase